MRWKCCLLGLEEDSISVSHIDHAISPKAHTPMYLMHKFWARKPHNVVAEYIKHYSKEGEIVLDPFVGSGVTAIEALKHGRKAIAIDLDPVATFITRMTLIPVDLNKFKRAFEDLKDKLEMKINDFYYTKCPQCGRKATILATVWLRDRNEPIEIRLFCPNCNKRLRKEPTREDMQKIAEIEKLEIPYWYPKDELKYPNSKEFMKKEVIGEVPNLFTKRNLFALSILWHEVESIIDIKIRNLMKFAFTSMVHLASKLCPVAKPSPRSHWSKLSATSFWAVHSYWVPPRYMESNVWMLFESSIFGKQGVLKGKEEAKKAILYYKEAKKFDDLRDDANIWIITGSALNLENIGIPKEEIDYVFTDPPYGGSIQYMELSTLWASWLKGKNNDPRFTLNFDEEITINNAQGKDFETYHRMLRNAFEEIYEVLRPGRWLTVTFHNTQVKIFNSIIKAVVMAGFDLEKIIYQPPARASAKGLLQPYGSAIGDYYIRFRKPKRKATLTESEIDRERYERIVVDTVKKIIAERGEPTSYSTIINSYPTIYDELKKNGYLFSAPEGIGDILKKHLNKEFILVDVKDKNGKVIGKKWWLKGVYFLDRTPLSERVEQAVINVLNRKYRVSFDDVLEEIFTKFPNALTPDTQSVRDILEMYGEKTKDGKWTLKSSVKVREQEHDKIVEILAIIGKKAGYNVHADIPGWRKNKFPGVPLENIRNVREIDVVWFTNIQITHEFEVENTTGIWSAIIRGSSIPNGKVKRFIVIPEERQETFYNKINVPALKERVQKENWRFILYDDLKAFFNSVKRKKKINVEDFEKISKEPKLPKKAVESLEIFMEN